MPSNRDQLLTIVTIVKDHADGLQATYESILRQTYQELELCIIVAESSDGTLPLAKSMAKSDSRVRVFLQEGVGIYSAMNMGLQVASGQFIWFMNAGDQFSTPQVLDAALKEMLTTASGLLIGGYQVVRGKKDSRYAFSKKRISEINFAFNRRSGCHQSMLFRTEALRSTGGFDLRYQLASDFDSVLKVIRHSGAFRVAEVYSLVEPGGAADRNIFKVHYEKHQIRRAFFKSGPVSILSLIWTAAASSKVLIRQFLWLGRVKSLLI